jgi:arylsulfatase A-like enzyme
METVDKEFLDASLQFIDKAHSQDKPFFVWFNTTRMHIWTHLAPEFLDKSGRGLYADGRMEPDVKEKLLHGMKAGSMGYKVHLDGYNLLPYLRGKETESPRQEFYYFSDDGNLLAIRYKRWKLHFSIQEHRGFEVWSRQFTSLRVPLIIDIEADPRADLGGL